MNTEEGSPQNSVDDSNGIIDSGVVKCPDQGCSVPETDFGTFMRHVLMKHGEKTALVDENSGAHLSYYQLEQASMKVAGAMRNLGFQPGDVAGFASENCVDLVVAFYGAIFAGATLTFAKTNLTGREIQGLFANTRPTIVFCDVHQAEKVKEACRELTSVKWFVVFGTMDGALEFSTFKSTSQPIPAPEARDPGDVLFIYHTSGSTGLPKAALITHRNFLSLICCFGYEIPAVTTRGVYIASLPLMHSMGPWLFCTMQMFGAMIVLLPSMNVVSLLMAAQKYEDILLLLYPTSILQTIQAMQGEHFDLKNVRAIAIGGTTISSRLLRELCAKAPNAAVLQGYGLTETATAVTGCRQPCLDSHCVGMPIALTEIKVVDLTTRELLGPHQSGEICIRGPTCFKGYLDMPEETAKMYDNDGFLLTGDTGYYTEKGHIHVTGRIKDLIKCMDQQVGPAELEELLLAHPDVKEAVVAGVPHKEFGEAARAFVVLKDGRPRDQATHESIQSFVNGSVAFHKQLHGGIEFIESLPKTETGKALRTKLCEGYMANIGAE